MRYQETMQLMEALKQHPVQGTLIILLIVALLAFLIYLDKKKK
ncbi:hypothetical protein [Desulfitobacterium sp. LBE]|nr:hypothetical protein [Desulfitobacterium sp. LBE]